MQPDKTEDALLDNRLDDICEGFTEAIDREVERRRREGPRGGRMKAEVGVSLIRE